MASELLILPPFFVPDRVGLVAEKDLFLFDFGTITFSLEKAYYRVESQWAFWERNGGDRSMVEEDDDWEDDDSEEDDDWEDEEE